MQTIPQLSDFQKQVLKRTKEFIWHNDYPIWDVFIYLCCSSNAILLQLAKTGDLEVIKIGVELNMHTKAALELEDCTQQRSNKMRTIYEVTAGMLTNEAETTAEIIWINLNFMFELSTFLRREFTGMLQLKKRLNAVEGTKEKVEIFRDNAENICMATHNVVATLSQLKYS